MIELKPYKQNAKKHGAKQLLAIAESLREFGWQGYVEVDQDNVIITGHGRWMAYEKYKDNFNLEPIWVMCGDKTIHGQKSDKVLSKKQQMSLRIADNSIAELERVDRKKTIPDLIEMGEALAKITTYDMRDDLEKIDQDEPEEEFSKEVLEENNYVVLVFDNVMDWQVFSEKFDIKTVSSLDSKKGYERKGVGRVISGKKVLDEL